MGITEPCTHLQPAPSTSTQLLPAPSASTQLISTSTQFHPPPPSSFQPPPALCNTPNNIGTKILHVIVDTELFPIPETRNKSNESYRVCKDNLEAISQSSIRSSSLDVFSWKGVLKICGKFTGEQPCWSVISIKLLCYHTSAWLFSCKFAAYVQHTFSWEHI